MSRCSRATNAVHMELWMRKACKTKLFQKKRVSGKAMMDQRHDSSAECYMLWKPGIHFRETLLCQKGRWYERLIFSLCPNGVRRWLQPFDGAAARASIHGKKENLNDANLLGQSYRHGLRLVSVFTENVTVEG